VDLINSVIVYLQNFIAISEKTYHVNPLIFCILYFGSAVPLYYGYYRVGRSIIKYEKRENKSQGIDKKELKVGITISAIAWLIPYMYVILFGKLSLHIWIILIILILATGLLFYKTLKNKISKIIKN